MPSLNSKTPILAFAAVSSIASPNLVSEEGPVDLLSFNLDVRPILSDNCFHCHGQDANKREADLRLDTSDGATRDLGGYAAIVPGDPEASELLARITAEDVDEMMPPPDSNRHLTESQRETLRQWIEQGGEYDTHWAFTTPAKTDITDFDANPVDYFIQKRLQRDSRQLSPEASPETWLRRASFDLTGLPPTVSELRSFSQAVTNSGESAYEQAVDRLLASAHFGERLAIDWMDAARYADTHGFNNDSTRSMWRWRDWVIDAFNQNMPYDQFITEQLAGDLLPSPTLEQRIATGFNRNHGINSEGGIIDEEYRVEYVADRVRTVGMVWMGLTTECARCHDHKYDPMTQEDYYRLFAFFNNVSEIGEDGRVANAVPMIPAPTQEQEQRLARLEDTAEVLRREIEQRLDQASASLDLLPGAQARLNAIVDEPDIKPVWRIASPTDTSDGVYMAPDRGDDLVPPPDPFALVSARGKSAGHIAADAFVYEEKSNALTIAFWIRPNAGNPREAPILSNADFDSEISSSNHGSGWDLRLIGDEIEIAFAKRYPAYAAILRTRSADIKPGQWRHVAVRFTGRKLEDNAYTPASRFRIHIDGREARTIVRHDGLQDFPAKSKEATSIGSDSRPGSDRFLGMIDEIQQFDKSLEAEVIFDLFQREALQRALGGERMGDKVVNGIKELTGIERKWVAAAALGQSADSEWQSLTEKYERAMAELLQLEREIPTTMVMEERPEMRETFVLQRGHYDARGRRVEAGVPESWIAPWPEGAPRNRLGLAQWLVQPDQPLTSRVVVNRFWQHLFGTGLVKTAEDFGIQSEYPSHPELLDWLAVDFRESGWDVKRFFKQIALSKTYRQRSAMNPEMARADPENRLLARGPRLRLPAEAVRDQALAISGLLDKSVGGPSVRPYQPEGLYSNTVVGANYPSTTWIESEGSDIYRRSLYTFWKRTVPHPLMMTFDAPDREVCSVTRSRTNTPIQALALMNGPAFVEASRALAESLLAQAGQSPEDRIAHAFQLATGRRPENQELDTLLNALEEMEASFEAEPEEAKAFLTVGRRPPNRDHPPAKLAAYAAIVSMILNLDETLTKG